MESTETTLPDGKSASLRIHRSGSVEATVGGQSYQLRPAASGGEGSGAAGAAAASPGPISMSSPGSSRFAMGELNSSRRPTVSPGAAYLASSSLAHSVLAQSSFSTNVHNSRAVLLRSARCRTRSAFWR